MGTSGNWLKSLITPRKHNPNDHDKVGGKSKKRWRLWRNPSVKGKPEPFDHQSSTASIDAGLNAAMAVVMRAPSKDFLMIRQEWAAIRIQTAFRAFLAKRALKALKALVRLQAIVRGRLVRKQAAVTLRCMQALVRAQAHVKAQRARMALEGQATKSLENLFQADPVKRAEEGWCNIRGSAEEVKTKLQTRQQAAMKRERAISYAASQQIRSSPNLNPGKNKPVTVHQPPRLDKDGFGWSWLDRWMANKPWESRLMEDASSDSPYTSPLSKISSRLHRMTGGSNNSPLRPNYAGQTAQLCSEPRSKLLTGETSTSTSAISASLTPASSSTDKTDETGCSKPRYMSLTASNRAKQFGNKFSLNTNQRRPLMEIQNHHMSLTRTRFGGEARSSVQSVPHSAPICEDLYPPFQVDTCNWNRKYQ